MTTEHKPHSTHLETAWAKLRESAHFGNVDAELTPGESESLIEQYQTALDLLARVEPELIPNHDAAEELREKLLGGPPSPTSALVRDIRALLTSNPAKERPLYTDGSLAATPLPPGAESFQDTKP